MSGAFASELYRILSFIRSHTVTQRPAWPQDRHFRLSSTAAPQGGEGPLCGSLLVLAGGEGTG